MQSLSQEIDASGTHAKRDKSDRQGTLWKAAVQIYLVFTAPVVFSVASDVADLGWIAGSITILLVACITYYSSRLLSDCYRSPDPVHGKRNHSYMEAVRTHLDKKHVIMCGAFQFCEVISTVCTTITDTILAWRWDCRAIDLNHCFHDKNRHGECHANIIPYWKTFAGVQIILFLFPRIDLNSWFLNGGFVAQLVSDAITLILAVTKVFVSHKVKGSIAGASLSLKEKILRSSQAAADIALVFSDPFIFLEIQDTPKSPPAENVTMKRASFLGISMAYAFYMLVGFGGYAAFGNKVPPYLLDGFTNPFWLVNIANFTASLSNIVAYQVVGQPLFDKVEILLRKRWPNSPFLSKTVVFRLLRSSIFVGSTMCAVSFVPGFDDMINIIGCFSFWALTAYYPMKMYIAQYNIQKWSLKWIRIYTLLACCTALFIPLLTGTLYAFTMSIKSPQTLYDQISS